MFTKEIQKIHSYAVLMAMYENGLDIINCFVPIVLQFVPEYDFTNVSIIKHDLEEVVDLPELMVKKVLDIAKDKDYVDVDVDVDEQNELYRRRSDVMQELIEEQENVTKRIRKFTRRIWRYCINNGIVPTMSIPQMIEVFIEKCGFNLDFLHPDYAVSTIVVELEDRSLKGLIQFLQDPTTQPADFTTFKELVMGSIISKALDWTDLDSTNLEGFNTCEIFLDTNFVFSLLGLHERRINKPVLEMHNKLMRRFDFGLKVFDFTLEQMKRVILAYSPESIIYAPDAQIPSIHNTFKGKRWGKEHAEKFAEKLPYELEKRGITVYDTGLKLDENHGNISKSLDEFINLYKELFVQYKPDSKKYGICHDLAAIWMTQKIRGGSVRNIGCTKAFFLTSDRKLAHFCEREMGHMVEHSISEVVLDMSFATMLWCLLKDNKVHFTINTIIAAFSRTLFISRKIWEKFMSVLSQMAKKKRFSLEETPNIFYKKIQNVLSNFSDSDVDKINESLLMAKIAEACTDSEVLHDKIHQMRDVIAIRERQIESQATEINELELMNKEAKSKIEEYTIHQKNLTLVIKILVPFIIALIILLTYIFFS